MACIFCKGPSAVPISTPRLLARTRLFPPPPPLLNQQPVAVTAPSWRWRDSNSLIRPIVSSSAKARCQPEEKSSLQSHDAAALEAAPKLTPLQILLWLLAGVYVVWLFILPYAPGDPIWAIKLDTIKMLLDLSLNFLFIIPVANLLGIHIVESPTVHSTAEALFNLIMGWSIMFAPLLFTDERRKQFGGSLVVLWGIQMFLTNTVLVPYMAVRLNHKLRKNDLPYETPGLMKLDLSGVQKVMVSGAKVVSAICGMVGLISILWFFLGRPDEGFGNASDRWTFFLQYIFSDRLGYAFIWDICLYSLFQPWLIGDNVDKVDETKSEMIGYVRFVPYMGLVAYLWALSNHKNREI